MASARRIRVVAGAGMRWPLNNRARVPGVRWAWVVRCAWVHCRATQAVRTHAAKALNGGSGAVIGGGEEDVGG